MCWCAVKKLLTHSLVTFLGRWTIVGKDWCFTSVLSFLVLTPKLLSARPPRDAVKVCKRFDATCMGQRLIMPPTRLRTIGDRSLRGTPAILQEMVYKTRITDLELSTTPLTLPQWRHDPAWPTPFSVTVSVRSDHWCVFCTNSLAIFPHAVINWI